MLYAAYILAGSLCIGHESIDGRLVVLSALPYDLDALSCGTSVLYPFFHRIVQGGASEAASDDEYMLHFRVEAVELHCLCLHLFVCGHDLLPDRVSRENNPVGREEPLHSLICHADAPGLLAENLVGQAGKSVLLLDQCRNAHAACRPQKGSARIAAHADGDVRPELADHLLRHAYALDDLERQSEVRQCEFPLQSCYRKTDYLIAGSRNLLHLHPSVCSDEKDFGFRIKFLELACDRECREYVSSSAASTDDCADLSVRHISFSIFSILLLAILLIESIMPNATQNTRNALAPWLISGSVCPVIGPMSTLTMMCMNA